MGIIIVEETTVVFRELALSVYRVKVLSLENSRPLDGKSRSSVGSAPFHLKMVCMIHVHSSPRGLEVENCICQMAGRVCSDWNLFQRRITISYT